MTTRKRVGGGFKIVHPKTISPVIDNRKDCNFETEHLQDEPIGIENTHGDVTNHRDDVTHESYSTESPTVKDKHGRLPAITDKNGQLQLHVVDKTISRQTEKLELPFIPTDKNPSLVLSREVSEKTDSSTEKEKNDFHYDDHPILNHMQESVIGHDLVINTPFGETPVTYCDFTASGRGLSFIEDFIRSTVYPTYANTHSSTGHNARQTTKFREDARNIIRQCVNASKDDVVIFTGSGATAAIHKLIWGLKINQHRVAEETVVFIGPYEHHSNILPWREFGTQIVRIRDDANGLVDLRQLKTELKFWKEKRRHMLVCMSATSNVTGIITDVAAVSKIAHKHGAMVVFDYAAGAPYLDIDMNPSVKNSYIDAIILSPHKFVGGPGTPGLLVAKRWMFKNSVPDRVGGGTVRFVTRETHAYVGHIEEKEEGGTPAIIESIRAGMVFQLKREIGHDVIYTREEELCQKAFAKWEQNPCIFILGSHTAPRVPIFSFLTLHPLTGKLIHHNFISTLLSDLFGIQARGGCACAGPYAEDLMGISEPIAKRYLWFLSDKAGGQDNSRPRIIMEVMKPGFTRINLAYFYDDGVIDFIIDAIDLVTRYGWKLLPEYTFDCRTGSWWHKNFANLPESELRSLNQFDVNMASCGTCPDVKKTSPSLKEILQRGENILTEVDDSPRSRVSSASRALRDYLPRDKRGLRWFLTPQEAINILGDTEEKISNRKKCRLPFKLVPSETRTLTSRTSSAENVDKTDHTLRRSTDNVAVDLSSQSDHTQEITDNAVSQLITQSDRKATGSSVSELKVSHGTPRLDHAQDRKARKATNFGT